MNVISKSVSSLLGEFYRCPELAGDFTLQPDLSAVPGYFRVGEDLVCYGRLAHEQPAATASASLADVAPHLGRTGNRCSLPFDPVEVVANLRSERYAALREAAGTNGNGLVRRLYYLLRPLMPVGVRKHLQRFSLRRWSRIAFPHWPVDRTVDRLHEWMMGLAMQAAGETEVPFVWFWPEGHAACVLLTHDVETGTGRDFCHALMDIDDEFGIKASFQVVPEDRYAVPEALLAEMRNRGFEINVHDLNHDGHLFSERREFVRRAARINQYGREFGARGFRSASLYRNQEWLSELRFHYDMSVPNVAHLDAQRGGCCTLMPYFVGDLLEIPLTTTQDYSLFHILTDYSTRLWQQQLDAILQAHGLASFNIHPDYVIEKRARATYRELLHRLADLRSSQGVWIALPNEVHDWWRARSQMQIVREGRTWRVEGRGAERARVAFARAEEGRIVYRLEDRTPSLPPRGDRR